MKMLRVRYLISIVIIGALLLSVFGAVTASDVDEGYIISKNSDYTSNDLEFDQTTDTIYMKIWNSVVGDNPNLKKWSITDSQDHKESGGLSPDGYSPGGTKTFIANTPASNFAIGDATLTMQLQSGKNKYKVTETITILAGGNQPPPEPSWIEPDSTNDNTPHVYWESVTDPNSDTVYYYIKIGTSSGGIDVLPETSTGTNAFYDVATPMGDGTYYVNVRSYDGEFYSNWHEETMVVDLTPPVITAGPTATPTATTAEIEWTTDELSDSKVEYGLTTGYGLSESDSAFVTDHSITLTSLTPETTYHYRVSSKDQLDNGPTYSADDTFTTLEGGAQQPQELKVTSCDINDVSNPECYNAISTDGGTSYALTKSYHIDAPFQILSEVAAVNSATLYYDSWGSLTGTWEIYLKDARDGNVICSADPAPEDGSETRNSIDCNDITPTQLENGVWLYVVNNDDKKPENINLDYVYLYVDYTPVAPVTEMWVDDDYTPESCGGHEWGVDAFNRIQSAIYAAEEDLNTTINILSGDYYERITIDKPVKLKGELAEGQFVTNIKGESGDKWALICVSANDMGASNQYPDRDCFPAQGLQAYYTLKNLGYDDDHIILMLWHDDEKGYKDENDQVICEDDPNTPGIENDGDDIDEWININYFTDGNWENELYGPDGIKDNADDPIIDVDNKAVTKTALQQQITNLANQVTRDDHILFYFVNHGRKYGTPERTHIYFEDSTHGTTGHYLDAETLDSWLDQIDCKRMTILFDICRTQNFINSAPGLTEEPNRIIMGAAGDIDNIAHAWFQARYQHPTDGSHFAGSWFFHPFWERIDASDSVQQAYHYALKASDQMAEDKSYAYQYPILFDKVRDANEYSLVPYGGNVINFLNGAGGDTEISKCLISGAETSIGISVERHYVGLAQALVNDNSEQYNDVTDKCKEDGSYYFYFFPSSQTTEDSFMLCGSNIFTRIYVKLSPGGAGSGGSYVVECATDRNTWVAATVQSDNTNDLTQTGDILFIPPLEWAYQSHIHPKTNEKSEYSYWVRLRLIDEYENIPQGDFIDLSYYPEGSQNITNNRIIGNDYAIYIKGISTQMINQGPISSCIIKNNEVYSNNYGVYLEYCKETEIFGNSIDSNSHGIELYSCNYTLIYHNNIIDNTNQAYDSNPANNDWHHPDLLEGNYWSDYSGVDDGSGTGKHASAGDGIGDTNIPHPGENYDNYPFMQENGWKN